MASQSRDPAGAMVTTDGGSSELARVEADIARTRDQVTRSVSALREAVVRRTDWREWVRRRPGWFLGAALALGFFWGRRHPGGAAGRITQSRRNRPWK